MLNKEKWILQNEEKIFINNIKCYLSLFYKCMFSVAIETYFLSQEISFIKRKNIKVRRQENIFFISFFYYIYFFLI